MDTDERFKHLAKDPRFKNLRKRQKKVEIDERFKAVFTDEKFTLKYSKDKRGRNQKKTTGDDLRKYYSQPKEKKKTDSQNQESQENDSEAKTEEEDVSEPIELLASESEVSSSSDESDSEVEDPEEAENALDTPQIRYNWAPLDEDAETADTTSKRIAIQNLDWDNLDVKDIYVLVNSIMPPSSVKIYISEFGKERLKREEVEGPQEIVDMPKVDEEEEEYNMLKDKMRVLKNQEPKSYGVNEYEDADEEVDPKNDELRERIRRYQLNRMKYYYAVVEFDSVDAAEAVYKELDGIEYEGSSLELDLRFISDDVEFDAADVKDECNSLPDLASYKVPQFINSALQQTTVKFTWDETDVKRQDKLRKAFTKEELEKDDLEAYLATESETDDEEQEEEEEELSNADGVSVVTVNSEARANKYRMLLKSLEEEEEKKKKTDVHVDWDAQFSDNQDDLGSSEESDFESHSSDSETALKKKKADGKKKAEDEADLQMFIKNKKAKSRKNKKERRARDESEHEESGRDEELDLLVMDVKDSERGEFKFNPDDERFKAVYESGLYNVDPSHPNFKRTDALNMIAERKRKKRK